MLYNKENDLMQVNDVKITLFAFTENTKPKHMNKTNK